MGTKFGHGADDTGGALSLKLVKIELYPVLCLKTSGRHSREV